MSIASAYSQMREDIRVILRNDPAARSIFDVALYPGLHAIIIHRLAHLLWKRSFFFIARLLSQVSRFLTGIEIHPGATIGRGCFIDHGMSVVIGETTTIGDYVTIYQGVTLGGTGKERGKRHPTIGDHVVIGVGASVLGAITIGDHTRIGAGAVVVKDVPAHATAVGVPARIVTTRDAETGAARRVERLPDPEDAMFKVLHERMLHLESRILNLEDQHTQRDERHSMVEAMFARLNGNGSNERERCA